MKKTRQTDEEVGRQHQGMDRPGVRLVPVENKEKWRKLVAKSSVVPLAVKGLMMMMMIMMLSGLCCRL